MKPLKYRWLTAGQTYRYGPKLGKGDDARRGTFCRVLMLPRPGSRPANVLVQFADRYTAIVPSGVLRTP